MLSLLKTLKKAAFVFALTGGMTQAALAGEKDFLNFFESFEGSWRGNGAKIVLQADGPERETAHQLELETDDTRRDQWTTSGEFRTRDGIISYSRVEFRVAGDNLYISTSSPNDPAEILQSSPRALVWRSYRTDWLLRRTFVFITRLELTSNRDLAFEETVTFNGRRIESQTATLRRR